MIKPTTVILAISLSVLIMTAAIAQTIILWDGSKIEGEIITQDAKYVYISTGGIFPKQIKQDDIKRINLLPH